MEMKELLENKGFSEDKTCIVNGSALCSCGPKAWASGGVVEVEAIKELMDRKKEDNAKYYGHFGAGARTSLGPKLQNYKTLVGGWAVTS